MARPSKRTDEMVEYILEELSDGVTMAALFKDSDLPTRQNFNKWRVTDKELDQSVFSAMLRGYQAHADEAAETQLIIMRGKFKGDPKQAQAAVTAANNLGHQALAKLSKLDTRYKDKQEITHTGPMVIGWDEPQVNDKKPLLDAYLDAITPESPAN
jgi:hypothetical protein